MAYRIMQPRFPLGRTVATPTVMALSIDLASYMHRHHCGDWGDLEEGDKQLNEEAEDEALALNEETTASPKTGDKAVNAYVSALSRTLKK